MNLYRAEIEVGKPAAFYWADSFDDAYDALKADLPGETRYAVMDASQADYDAYHGPDYTGRKFWLVFDHIGDRDQYLRSPYYTLEGLLYGIEADDYAQAYALDPAPFDECRVLVVAHEVELLLLDVEGRDR